MSTRLTSSNKSFTDSSQRFFQLPLNNRSPFLFLRTLTTSASVMLTGWSWSSSEMLSTISPCVACIVSSWPNVPHYMGKGKNHTLSEKPRNMASILRGQTSYRSCMSCSEMQMRLLGWKNSCIWYPFEPMAGLTSHFCFSIVSNVTQSRPPMFMMIKEESYMVRTSTGADWFAVEKAPGSVNNVPYCKPVMGRGNSAV
jgi:hypothetical protein